jgi:hypothetical protein
MRHVLLLALLATCAAPPADAQVRRLPAPDSTAGNHFGAAVALDARTAIVGASGEGACGPNSGAAYAFARRPDGAFAEGTPLAPAACDEGRFFGRTVAVSGEHAAVAAGGHAATGPNTVHVFERQPGGGWRETATLLAPEPDEQATFGSALGLEGHRLAVAMPRAAGRGAVFVYERQPGGGWHLAATLRAPDMPGHFASDVALDGDRLAVSASPFEHGAQAGVALFERQPGGDWHRAATLDGFVAHTLRIALAGNILAAGEVDAGADRSGKVSVFGRRSDGQWRRQSTLLADVPYRHGAFGSLVAIERSPAGPRLLAVGYTEQLGRDTNIDRVVHVFGYDADRGWVQRQLLDIGDWAFGMAIAVASGTALVGRSADHSPGAVYAVELLD